jgi:hypothetical protein
VFSSLTGRREREDFEWFREYFPVIESHNSHMPQSANARAASLARQWDKIGIGGSDAHALASVGKAFTEVPEARNKEEFFAGLRSGAGRVAGESGSFTRLTRDVFLIAFEMMREKSWTTALTPLAVLVPVITFLNYRNEAAFGRRWAPQVLDELPDSPKRARWAGIAQPALEDSI